MIIQTREGLIDKVFEEVEKKISLLRKNPIYPEYLEKRLLKSINDMREKHIKVIIDKRDESIFKKIISNASKKIDIECIIEISPVKTLGGFILTDSKERVRINYTIENLLEVSRENIRTKINELLFKGWSNGSFSC